MSEKSRSASQVETLPLAHVWKDAAGERVGALYGHISLIPEFARRDAERDVLRARIAELEAALERHGGHLRGCPVRFEQYAECNCGLAQALRGEGTP